MCIIATITFDIHKIYHYYHDYIECQQQAAIIMSNDVLVMDAGEQQEIEETLDHPARGSRIFLSIKRPLKDPSGMVSGVVGVSIDITDRKRTEAEARIAIEDMLQQKTIALAQRDILLSEVYHRVKNNLQMIDSMLVLQGRVLTDTRAIEGLENLRGRIFALGLVHHQLMSANDFAVFDIAPFLRELIHNIADSGPANEIELFIEADAMSVGLDIAIPLGLIVTELVTNAVKHAFPSGRGSISVRLICEDDQAILLSVTDDGRGIATAQAESEIAKTGLGTSILKGLISQLQGTMTVRDNQGTSIEIRIDKPAS